MKKQTPILIGLVSLLSLSALAIGSGFAAWRVGDPSISAEGTSAQSLLYQVVFKKTADAVAYRTLSDLEIDTSFDLESGFEDGNHTNVFVGWSFGSRDASDPITEASLSVADLLTYGNPTSQIFTLTGVWARDKVIFDISYSTYHYYQYVEPTAKFYIYDLNPDFDGVSGRPSHFTHNYTDMRISNILEKDPFSPETGLYPNDYLKLAEKAGSTYQLTAEYS